MNKHPFLLFLLLWPALLLAQPQTVKNLVFEGAGIRGIAYSGAITELEARGLLPGIERIGGTSAGAITALLLCLNYSAEEITAVISSTDFKDFNQGRYLAAGGLARLKRYFGWYKTDAFEAWLSELIARKTGNADLTFAGLKRAGYKELYVTGTDLTAQKLVLFSFEHYPQMKVRDAVRISMSIPLYFEAVFMDSNGNIVMHPKNKQGLQTMVDGGFTGNFPIKLFDSTKYQNIAGPNRYAQNPQTIGFRIDAAQQILNDTAHKGLADLPVTNLKEYATAFYTLVIENLNRQTLTTDDWQRTVSISDGGIGPRIRRLKREETAALLQNGRIAAATYLDKTF